MTAELVPHPGGDLTADAELLARLRALDEAAARHVRKPRNTERNYAGDWRTWQRYVAELRIPERAATIGSFVGFVLWLRRDGKAPATVERRVYGVTVTLRVLGVDVPQEAADGARLALEEYKRDLAEAGETRGRGKASVVTIRDLRAMSAALPATLQGLRDRAALLLGIGVAARRSEVANLLARDVTTQEEGLKVEVRYGKSGARHPAIKKGTHSLTDPVAAWIAWRDAAGLDPEGSAFLAIDRHGNLGGRMSPAAVGNIVIRACELAGLPRKTWHGIRAGLATEARRAGHDVKTIAQQGGWSPTSRVLYEYMRIVDEWADNATAGLGL